MTFFLSLTRYPLENSSPESHFPILTCAAAVEARAKATSSADAKRGARRRMVAGGCERAESPERARMKMCEEESCSFSVGTWANW